MTAVAIDWETEIVNLLGEPTSVQDELFQSLRANQDCLARRDLDGTAD